MSGASQHLPLALGRWQRLALAVGALVLAVCIAGGAFDTAQFFRAYLAAYLFYLGLGLGAMVIVMIYHLTGGAWGILARRILEAQMRTLPLMALLFLPIAYGIAYLYPWAQLELVDRFELLRHQSIYLRPGWFWLRAAAYFALWIGMAGLLARWSRLHDRDPNPRLPWLCEQLSAFGLIVYGVSMHFMSVDWVMSIEPAFHSTIFGPLLASQQILSAHALALIALAGLVARRAMSDVFSLKALNDLGNLLLTFVVVWAYLAWFQFMLIWIANLPSDVSWYLPRFSGFWFWLILAIVAFAFVAPFLLLLSRSVKQRPALLGGVGGLLLVMQLLVAEYQVAPAFGLTSIARHWMDFLMPFALGGLWLAAFLRNLRSSALVPLNDASLAQAGLLRQLDEDETALEEELANA
jgi:hypothetical protein